MTGAEEEMGDLYKMSSAKRVSISIFCMISLLVLFVACESQKETVDPKILLKSLAEKYWTDRLVNFDYESTYKMESQKDSITYSEYLPKVRNAKQIKVLSIKANEVTINDDKAVVKLTTMCQVPSIPKELELPLEDVWIKKSKEWKHQLPEK